MRVRRNPNPHPNPNLVPLRGLRAQAAAQGLLAAQHGHASLGLLLLVRAVLGAVEPTVVQQQRARLTRAREVVQPLALVQVAAHRCARLAAAGAERLRVKVRVRLRVRVS